MTIHGKFMVIYDKTNTNYHAPPMNLTPENMDTPGQRILLQHAEKKTIVTAVTIVSHRGDNCFSPR